MTGFFVSDSWLLAEAKEGDAAAWGVLSGAAGPGPWWRPAASSIGREREACGADERPRVRTPRDIAQ